MSIEPYAVGAPVSIEPLKDVRNCTDNSRLLCMYTESIMEMNRKNPTLPSYSPYCGGNGQKHNGCVVAHNGSERITECNGRECRIKEVTSV